MRRTNLTRNSTTLRFKPCTYSREKCVMRELIRLSIQIPEDNHDWTFAACYNYQAFPDHQGRRNDHTKIQHLIQEL